MAEKDLSAKKLEDYSDVFADIYNTLLFRRQVLFPEQLRSGPTESIYTTDSREFHSQGRDILKRYHNQANLVISSFGIENQAYIDKNMPIRIMGYDVGTYQQQIHDRESVITPVITIVLNMTEKRWTAPKSLHGMLDIAPELAGYVQDYKIYVYDVAFLDDETIQSFNSDFGEIARFFKRRRLGQDPLSSGKVLEHPREIMEFISVFTQDRRYLNSVPHLENIQRKGGAATMCAVVDAILTEGMEKGIAQGMEKGIAQGLEKGIEQGIAQGIPQGIAQGIAQGETIQLISMICRKMKKGKNAVVIAEELDEETEVVERIYEVAKSFAPEYDAREIFKVLPSE